MQIKKAIIFFNLLLFSFSAFIAPAQSRQGWNLVWQDEFNYTGLPDAKKWRYETGHIRNNEQQYYTYARKENVWVNNGVLTITGRKENYRNQFYKKRVCKPAVQTFFGNIHIRKY